MMTNAKIGTALVGGYLLGRTKKAKLAIGLGMFLAGRKISLDPQALKRLVADSPVFGALNTQVREEILDATKHAATSALTKRVGGFADSLHERTLSLGSSDASDEPDEPDDDAGEPPAPKRRTARRSESSDEASGTRRARSAPAKARKTASSGTRKTASKASGRTSGRGGGNA